MTPVQESKMKARAAKLAPAKPGNKKAIRYESQPFSVWMAITPENIVWMAKVFGDSNKPGHGKVKIVWEVRGSKKTGRVALVKERTA